MQKREFLGCLVASPWWLTACGGGNDGQVRLLAASVGYPALDGYVKGEKVGTGLTFGTASAYASILSGTVDTAWREAGSSVDLLTGEIGVSARGDAGTLIAWGGAGALSQIWVSEEDDTPASDQVRLSVLHLATEAGALDVYLTTETADLDASTPLISQPATGTESASVDATAAGPWRLRITAAGDPLDVRWDRSGLSWPGGSRQRLVIAASTGGVLVHVLSMPQRGAVTPWLNAQARVGLVASLGDGAAVTATLGGQPLALAQVPPSVGVPVALPSGAALLQVAVGSTALAEQTLTLDQAGEYTLLVCGANESSAITAVLTDDNRSPSIATRAMLRLVHAAPQLAGQTLTLSANLAVVASGVGYTQASTPAMVVPANATSLSVTASGSATPVVSLTDLALAAGGVYTLFVVEGLDGVAGVLRQDR